MSEEILQKGKLEGRAALIDLDKVVRDRAGKKAKYVPRFLINRLKRLIHQDFINGFLKEGYVGVDFCEHSLKYLDVKVEVEETM